MTVAQKITSEALTLSPKDRANIAQILLQSLEMSENHEDKWLVEVSKRADEYEKGAADTNFWEELKSFVVKS